MNLRGAAPVPATKAAQPADAPCCLAGCPGAGGSHRSSCRPLLPLAARQLCLQPANQNEVLSFLHCNVASVHGRCALGKAPSLLSSPVQCGLQPLITACCTGGIATQGCTCGPWDGAPATGLEPITAWKHSAPSCCNGRGQPCSL